MENHYPKERKKMYNRKEILHNRYTSEKEESRKYGS